MIVSVSGYNWSGASAVLDLLNEYEETKVIYSPEWYIIDQPDGIRDLAFHIMGTGTYMSSDVAVQRFLHFVRAHDDYDKATDNKFVSISENYINELIQFSWDGHSSYDLFRLSPMEKRIWTIRNYIDIAINKFMHKQLNLVDRKMYLCIKPDKFLEKTKEYINELIYAAGGSKDKVNVVKQLFPANNPAPDFQYVDDPYVIVVDRDPRDIYVQCNSEKVTCFPCKDVKQYVEYYKSWRIEKDIFDNPRVLRIQFEDLDYKYDETVKRIEELLKLERHVMPKKYFDPVKSIKTTHIYTNYPKLEKDIKYIEENLSEYLYDWSEDR